MQNIYDQKRAALEPLIDQNKDDKELVRVYRAKLEKEMAGKKRQKDPIYMSSILDEFDPFPSVRARPLHQPLDGT